MRIIDCLEFNPRLRAVDPFDEIAFLSLECDRLGAGWAGKYIARRVMRGLRDGLSEELFLFYRCHRAMLRARLAIAHLLEPNPRTPDKWPRLARAYLRIAAADAIRLERSLKRRANRPAQSPPRSRRITSATSGAAGSTSTLSSAARVASRNGGTASVITSRSMAGSARTSAAPAMNRPWVTRAITRRAPACSSCPCSAQQRASGADQVVDNQRGRSSHIADEEVARDHAGAAVLVGKSLADRTAERLLQRLAEQLRPLGAARIRRHDGEFLVLQGPHIIDEQRRGGQRDGAAAERVLECDRVMDLERDDAIGPHRLEHARDVAGGDRIARLGATIFSRITEIWHDGRDTGGAGILQRPDEEQEPAELVVFRFRRAAVQALDDVDTRAVDRLERARLMLAVFEFPLFMRGHLAAERLRDCRAEDGRCLQREQSKSRARTSLRRSVPTRPDCIRCHR